MRLQASEVAFFALTGSPTAATRLAATVERLLEESPIATAPCWPGRGGLIHHQPAPASGPRRIRMGASMRLPCPGGNAQTVKASLFLRAVAATASVYG